MSTAVAAKPVGNKPIVKKQFGNISVAVFAREVSTPQGEIFTAKDYVVQKSWKNKQGQWQDQSITLKAREILAVQKALDEAYVESYEETSGEDQ